MVIEFFFNNCMILKFQNIMTFLDKPIIIQVGCQFLNTNTLYIYMAILFLSLSQNMVTLGQNFQKESFVNNDVV